MNDLQRRIAALAKRLTPLETPFSEMVVSGFSPPRSTPWRPRRAAVLVPLILHPEPAIALIVRSDDKGMHAGQVALPGGLHQDGEPYPVATALREATEEIGLDSDAVRLLGLLDCVDTISAYRVTPVVGLVSRMPEWRPCAREVSHVFTLPLALVLNPGSYRRHHLARDGRVYTIWSMQSRVWPVWGATAAILRQLAECFEAGRHEEG